MRLTVDPAAHSRGCLADLVLVSIEQRHARISVKGAWEGSPVLQDDRRLALATRTC
jgi:hypothetical protein